MHLYLMLFFGGYCAKQFFLQTDSLQTLPKHQNGQSLAKPNECDPSVIQMTVSTNCTLTPVTLYFNESARSFAQAVLLQLSIFSFHREYLDNYLANGYGSVITCTMVDGKPSVLTL